MLFRHEPVSLFFSHQVWTAPLALCSSKTLAYRRPPPSRLPLLPRLKGTFFRDFIPSNTIPLTKRFRENLWIGKDCAEHRWEKVWNIHGMFGWHESFRLFGRNCTSRSSLEGLNEPVIIHHITQSLLLIQSLSHSSRKLYVSHRKYCPLKCLSLSGTA